MTATLTHPEITKVNGNGSGAPIQLAVFDMDGTLTDDVIIISTPLTEHTDKSNDTTSRFFTTRDFSGMRMLQDAGVLVAIITGSSNYNAKVCLRHIPNDIHHMGRLDKLTALKEVCTELGVTLNKTAYMGDDTPDIPALQAVQLPSCPVDAHPQVYDTVTKSGGFIPGNIGGNGAVRALCDHILDINATAVKLSNHST